MSTLALIAVGNVVVWAVILGLMFRLEAGRRGVEASLSELEQRFGGDNMSEW